MEKEPINSASEEIFDVSYFVTKLEDIQKNEEEETRKFKERIIKRPGIVEIFDSFSPIEKRMVVMLGNLSEKEMLILSEHADEIMKFGLHDLPTTLNHISFLTEDYRYIKIADSIALKKIIVKNAPLT